VIFKTVLTPGIVMLPMSVVSHEDTRHPISGS
jgi:hypothetical protein